MKGKKHPFNKCQNKGVQKKPFKKGTVMVKRTGLMALGAPDVSNSDAGVLGSGSGRPSFQSGDHDRGAGEAGIHGSGAAETMQSVFTTVARARSAFASAVRP